MRDQEPPDLMVSPLEGNRFLHRIPSLLLFVRPVLAVLERRLPAVQLHLGRRLYEHLGTISQSIKKAMEQRHRLSVRLRKLDHRSWRPGREFNRGKLIGYIRLCP